MRLNVPRKPLCLQPPTILQRMTARCNALRVWHMWFAWYPVRLDNHTLIWWETVERRYVGAWVGTMTGTIHKENPQYRLLGE